MESPSNGLATILLDLWNQPKVQEAVQDTARQIFTSGNITVNLLPALAALAALAGLALLAIPFLFPPAADATATGYGVSSGYGGGDSCDCSGGGGGGGATGYAAPSDGYTGGRRRREVEVPGEASLLYEDIVAPHLKYQAERDDAGLSLTASLGRQQTAGLRLVA